jgi:hypothetical protein
MDHETFRLHLEKRHVPFGDFADLKGFHPGSTFAVNRRTMSVYHRHLHDRWDYPHEHQSE